MSFELLLCENSFFSSSDFASSEANDLHCCLDSFSPFSDSPPIDFLDFPQIDSINQNLSEKNVFLNQIVPQCHHAQLSSSPPSSQLENLSLSQINHFQPLTNCSNLATGYANFSGSEVIDPHGSSYNSIFLNQDFSVNQNVAQTLQRSCSSNSFSEGSVFHFPVMQTPNLHTHLEDSPKNAFLSARMRRVCSTGDLQEMKVNQIRHGCFVDETNFRVGRYSADERRERIHKYRAKRSQRNFNKTIKYACRKALADNRPRVRGRFIRNDDIGETPNTAVFIKDEDEDDLWLDGLHCEDYYEGTVRGGFLNNFGPTQCHYYDH